MAGGKKKSKHAGKHTKKKPREREQPTATAPETSDAARGDGITDPSAAAPDRARGRLTEMVPVRFDAETLHALKARAATDHRSVSSWIRRAVDLELDRPSP